MPTDEFTSTRVVLPILFEDAQKLVDNLDPGANSPDKLMITLATVDTSTAPINEINNAIGRLASEFTDFTVTTQRFRDLLDEHDEFIATVIELDSSETTAIRQRLEDVLENVGVHIPEDLFKAMLFVSDHPISHDRDALNMNLRVVDLEIRHGEDEIVQFTLGQEVEASFHVSSNTEFCDEDTPFGVVSEETGEVLSCHGTTEEAEEAIEALIAEQSNNSEELLINLSIDDNDPSLSESVTMPEEVATVAYTKDVDGLRELYDDQDNLIGQMDESLLVVDGNVMNQKITVGDAGVSMGGIFEDAQIWGTNGGGTEMNFTINTNNTTTKLIEDSILNLATTEAPLNNGDGDFRNKEEDATGRPDYDASGPIVLEGLETGDKRIITPGALSTRPGDLPFMFQPKNMGHFEAMLSGSIVDVQRQISSRGPEDFPTDTDTMINEMLGFIKFADTTAGNDAMTLLESGHMRGVSVDMDLVEIEFEVDDDDSFFAMFDARMRVTSARIMGATFLPFPAFAEAQILPVSQEDSLVAAGSAQNTMYLPQLRFNLPLEF